MKYAISWYFTAIMAMIFENKEELGNSLLKIKTETNK